jgi:hypothetical protein
MPVAGDHSKTGVKKSFQAVGVALQKPIGKSNDIAPELGIGGVDAMHMQGVA